MYCRRGEPPGPHLQVSDQRGDEGAGGWFNADRCYQRREGEEGINE